MKIAFLWSLILLVLLNYIVDAMVVHVFYWVTTDIFSCPCVPSKTSNGFLE